MRHGKTFDDGEVLRMFGVQPSDGPEPVETTITKTIGFSESAPLPISFLTCCVLID